MVTALLSVITVASLAPGFQISPYGMMPLNSSRPRATGRLYVIVSSVSAMVWETEPL